MRVEKTLKEARLAELIQHIEDIERKAKLLEGIPCGTEYPQCKFIKDANVAVANLPHVEKEQTQTEDTVHTFEKKIESMRPDFIKDQIDKYEKVIEKRNRVTNEIADINLSLERNQTSIERIGYELKELQEKKKKYEENKEAIENFEEFTTELDACNSKLEKTEKQHARCQQQTLELYKEEGSWEQKVQSIK